MIHIVFQPNDIAVLRKAFELDAFLQGELIGIADDLSVGPLKDIYSPEGREARAAWWRGILSAGDYEGLAERNVPADDHAVVTALIEKLRNDPEEKVWIWAAQNKRDVSGYYWLMSQLKDLQGRVFILYLNNLPFINEKGHIFYPVNLFDIPPREFLKARKLARPITLSEFETDPDEWTKLCNEGKGVRILEGGKKLVQYDVDFFDEELKKFITGDWIKAGKLIHQFQTKGKQMAGEVYLLWRVRCLVAAGELDIQGEQKGAKDIEIKKRTIPEAVAG